MPITLNKIANNVADVSIQVGEDTVHVTYYPSRITEKTFKQLQNFSNIDADTLESGFESFNEILSSLIKSWDVYEDDAQTIMYPINPDSLSELPITFRTSVLHAMLSDISPEVVSPQTTLN